MFAPLVQMKTGLHLRKNTRDKPEQPDQWDLATRAVQPVAAEAAGEDQKDTVALANERNDGREEDRKQNVTWQLKHYYCFIII